MRLRARLAHALVLLATAPVAAPAAVFINEIHYDDATAAGDVGEHRGAGRRAARRDARLLRGGRPVSGL